MTSYFLICFLFTYYYYFFFTFADFLYWRTSSDVSSDQAPAGDDDGSASSHQFSSRF